MKTVGSVTKEVTGVSAQEIYALWADVDNWHRFNQGIEWAKLDGGFAVGETFTLGLKGGQKVKIKLFEVTPNKSFTDMTSFPFAKMYGEHKIVEKEGKIELTATIKIDGALSFLWERLVAKNVADKLEEDMDAMIRLVKADG